MRRFRLVFLFITALAGCPTTIVNYTSDRWPMSCEPALLFLRIQKTSSSSWKSAFSAGWKIDNSRTTGCATTNCGHSVDMEKVVCKNSVVDQSGLIVARGHTPYDELQYFHRNQAGIMVTGLRDPVSRVVSEYTQVAQRWLLESPKAPDSRRRNMCAWEYRVFPSDLPAENFSVFFPPIATSATMANYTLRSEDLAAYVSEPLHEFGMRNRMTRMLAGYSVWRNAHPQESFDIAVQHLRTLPWFYIQERLEDSIALFEHHSGVKINLHHSNPTTVSKPELTNEALRIIEHYNTYDIALYEEANRIMDERLANINEV